MKTLIAVSTLATLLILSGCTNNIRSKSFGGKQTINLPKGQKFVNATWKNDNLWYITKPMNYNDVAETYTFSEKSNFGMLEGIVTFQETK